MPAPIQDRGFGLNFNQGFGRSGTVGSFSAVGDPEINRSAFQTGQNKQLMGLQHKQQLGRDQAQFGYQNALQGQQIQSNERMLSEQLKSQQIGMQAQNAQVRAQAEASMLGPRLQQQRFDTVFPFLSQALNGQGSFGAGYQGQGQVGTQPSIDASPVYSGNQVQQQVNAQRAQNDAGTATQQRAMSQQMAARGFGAQSPLAMELGLGLQNNNLMQNTANERDLRLGAAQANSQQVLAAQKAQEGQFASRQAEEIERNKVKQGYSNALLGLLGAAI